MTGYQVIIVDHRGATAKSYVVYDSENPNTYFITAMRLEKKTDTAGKFTFTFLPQHPYVEIMSVSGTEIRVKCGTTILFCGRPLTVTQDDIYNKMTVVAEGNLNWLADVGDHFTSPPSEIWDYKVGWHDAAVIQYKYLTFDELTEEDDEGNVTYTGVYSHIWVPDDYREIIDGATEEGREFEVTIGLPELADDGEGGKVIVSGSYVDTVTTFPYERYAERDKYGNETIYGFIGNIGYFNDSLELRTTKGSSAKFCTSPFNPPGADGEIRIEAKEHSEAGYHQITVKVAIRARKPLTVQQMFGFMFRLPADAESTTISDYNWLCSPVRRLYRGSCDVNGTLVYDAKKGGTCIDTLKAWQKEFGGYLYTTYSGGKWLINFTQATGVRDDTTVFRYGENLINIKKQRDVTKVVTEIEAVGIDDQTGEKFTTGTIESSTYPATGGYVKNMAAMNLLGVIETRKEYKIHHQTGDEGTAAMKLALYNAAVADLIDSMKKAESVSVTAIDPRLIGLSLDSVRVGDRYPVVSEPNGISYTGDNCLTLNSMTLDLLAPENSKLEFGESRPLLVNYITGG